jgi:hypothetical protein
VPRMVKAWASFVSWGVFGVGMGDPSEMLDIDVGRREEEPALEDSSSTASAIG